MSIIYLETLNIEWGQIDPKNNRRVLTSHSYFWRTFFRVQLMLSFSFLITVLIGYVDVNLSERGFVNQATPVCNAWPAWLYSNYANLLSAQHSAFSCDVLKIPTNTKNKQLRPSPYLFLAVEFPFEPTHVIILKAETYIIYIGHLLGKVFQHSVFAYGEGTLTKANPTVG